ncbi:MAG TPA: NAD+ synthase [Candidatus Omnitrophota bacterium]|nr:NAD+ synthase [Candidatus Omnitrophota bacterium]HSA30351.1 NAD+ synthase [Candidatus Omnitrophota bacterium]
MRIALAQINTTVGDLKGNSEKIIANIERAKRLGVDCVVFPEMTLCGYPPEDLVLKPHFIADNIKVLRSLKRHSRGINAVVGFVDRDSSGRIFNAAAVLSDGKIAGIYHKQHLPNYGVFDDRRYFVRGENNPVFQFGKLRIGLSICEDIWPDDGTHIEQAKRGADILLNMSGSPYDIGKLEIRQKLLARRAKEAQAFVFYVNLVGGQDEIVFDGGSCAYSPKGNVLASARLFEEDLLVLDVDSSVVSKKKRDKNVAALFSGKEGKKPGVSAQVRPASEKIERIYQALVLGTRDYVLKNGFKKVVVGLSGGIDSSLVACIAADAIGRENVVGVSMPSQYTSAGTYADARRVAENLKIGFHEIPLNPTFDAYRVALKDVFKGLPEGVAEENLQARIRGNYLMALSNKQGWLVLTTGNKSEMAVGYCTLYGDMSGGFAVIKDIYKTRVYELSRYRNAIEGGQVIPQSVLDRAPSAELKANQTDQDSLPPYDVLDEILMDYIERHRSFKQILKHIKEPQTVQRVLRLVDQSEYKRRQAPPGVKITPRAFGKDWRLPITNKYREY